MTYPTDAAIEAALNKWFRLSSPPEPHDYSPSEHDIDDMRAALIAARAAEPMPTMAEFDAALKTAIVSFDVLDTAIRHHVSNEGWRKFTNEHEAAKEALRSLFRRATGEGVGE